MKSITAKLKGFCKTNGFGETFKVITRLLRNGMRFRYLRLSGYPAMPQAASIEITHDCIARCVMCNIWKIPAGVPNLSIEDWLALFRSPAMADLRELDVTGGEPFLRNDLVDFFRGLCKIRHAFLKQLKTVALTTNGFLTKRVLVSVPDILDMLIHEKIELVMVCAMDAVGPLHDRIRNVRNAWSKLDATLQGLIRLRERYPNLIIGVKTTILPINIDELDKIADYADANRLFTIISPCIITGGRYLNTDLVNKLAFTNEDYLKMVRFFRKKPSGWSYHDRRLIDYFYTGAMKKACTCGFNYFFIRSNGDMYLCPLVNRSVGNISQQSPEAIFFSSEANRIRKQVGHFDECRLCTEPGLERFSLPMDGFSYLLLLHKIGCSAFLKFHRHMGLDKYID
jgi:MoaA/NifB/PqqE/SkfB family radical SAM enzyme